jgi:DNA-binding NtrC family response regulator
MPTDHSAKNPRGGIALRVLLVEDEPELREALADTIRAGGHVVDTAADGAQGLDRVGAAVFDVVITDVNLPKVDGLTLFRRLRKEWPSTSIILITAYGEIAQAVTALREGAYHYLSKPFDADELMVHLGHIAARRSLEGELEQARAKLAKQAPETLLIGESLSIRRALDKVDAVAGSDAPALIVGESGTGKELVARMIHDRSARRGRPYVAVNCGALTETLMEAELFGHERGAFTGAERKREGRFKAADGGTIFLDEVAELPLSAQAKLLRVLQEGTFEPLGSNTTIQVDVRIVSATHRNLRERVTRGQFREDLLYRINVIEIVLPPLRDRPGDLTLLARHFLERFTPEGRAIPSISTEAWAAISRHPFPGNVRELSHAIQHAVVLAGGQEITLEHLPTSITSPSFSPAAGDPPAVAGQPAAIRVLATVLREYEKAYLEAVMATLGLNNLRQAAQHLGLTPKMLRDKLRAHGLPTEPATG